METLRSAVVSGLDSYDADSSTFQAFLPSIVVMEVGDTVVALKGIEVIRQDDFASLVSQRGWFPSRPFARVDKLRCKGLDPLEACRIERLTDELSKETCVG